LGGSAGKPAHAGCRAGTTEASITRPPPPVRIAASAAPAQGSGPLRDHESDARCASGKALAQRRQPVAPAAAVKRRVVLAAQYPQAVAERCLVQVLRRQARQFVPDRRDLIGILAVEEGRHHGVGRIVLDVPVLVEVGGEEVLQRREVTHAWAARGFRAWSDNRSRFYSRCPTRRSAAAPASPRTRPRPGCRRAGWR